MKKNIVHCQRGTGVCYMGPESKLKRELSKSFTRKQFLNLVAKGGWEATKAVIVIDFLSELNKWLFTPAFGSEREGRRRVKREEGEPHTFEQSVHTSKGKYSKKEDRAPVNIEYTTSGLESFMRVKKGEHLLKEFSFIIPRPLEIEILDDGWSLIIREISGGKFKLTKPQGLDYHKKYMHIFKENYIEDYVMLSLDKKSLLQYNTIVFRYNLRRWGSPMILTDFGEFLDYLVDNTTYKYESSPPISKDEGGKKFIDRCIDCHHGKDRIKNQ